MREKFTKYGQKGILILMVAALVLSSCRIYTETERKMEQEMTVRISMYNDISYTAWRTYLEGKFPDVNFVWENNRNSTQNLIYQARHGDLADLVMIRRFENDSAQELAPYLMNLRQEKMTDTFEQTALEPFVFDQRLCWYPEPGMMECLYANVSLFRRNGIKIPETRAQLENACMAFEKLGIDGLSIDAAAGFRSTFLMEGFGYADCFDSGDGASWVKAIRNGQEAILSDSSAAAMTALLRRFRDTGVLQQADLTSSLSDAQSKFDSEKAAMFPFGSDLKYEGKSSNTYQVLPCFGDRKEDNFLYTYPVFNTAVSKNVEKDPEKKKQIEKILKIMYSNEAQQILAQGTEALISYNKGITLPISEQYQSVADLIAQKKFVIRFLNRNTFAACSQAITDIIRDDATDDSWTKRFNAKINQPLDDTVIGNCNIAADNQLGDTNALERPAASVIAQTAQTAAGADVAIIEGKTAAAPLYRGNYTVNDLNAVVVDEKLYEAAMTGKELQKLFDDTILGTTTYRYHMVEPLVDYPAISGMKAFWRQTAIGAY